MLYGLNTNNPLLVINNNNNNNNNYNYYYYYYSNSNSNSLLIFFIHTYIYIGTCLGLFVCGGQKLFAKINPNLGNYLQIAVLLPAFGSMSKCIKKPFLA